MKLFKKKKTETIPGKAAVYSAVRCAEDKQLLPESVEHWEKELYDRLRFTVPVIDAAISKIVRLTGGYRVICEDESMQELMDSFVSDVPVGLTGQSLQSFTDVYLDSLLTYGNAVGEIILDPETLTISSLYNGDPSKIAVIADKKTGLPVYCLKRQGNKLSAVSKQTLILFSALSPPAGKTMGVSVLRGLPSLSNVLMKIYNCIGQNYERAGNVRYAVTYKPSGDSSEMAYSRERAMQIAKEWSDGMTAAKNGEIRDFVAVGDVDIKVIGADNQLFDTEVPVRQIMEQLIAKLSVPPFLLGLSWST
ncbi:MAG: serine/threonine protein phosphatase, partial [Oscillospiraceae bacterium]|nr:serine/threonine protein phosphatase [Oscillospiraceae bacterium]